MTRDDRVAYLVQDRHSQADGVLLIPALAEPPPWALQGELADGDTYMCLHVSELAGLAFCDPACPPGAWADAVRFQAQILQSLGRPLEAQQAYATCAMLYERAEADEAQAMAWLAAGFLAVETGDLPAATRHAAWVYDRAMAWGATVPLGLAQVLAGKALCYCDQVAAGEQAIAAGLKALWEAEAHDAMLGALLHWGDVLLTLGRFKEASDTLHKAEALLGFAGSPEPAVTHARLAAALAIATRQPEAGARMQALLADARETGRELVLAYGLRWLAEWHASRKQPEQAIAALKEAEILAARAGLGPLTRELARLETRLAQPASAPGSPGVGQLQRLSELVAEVSRETSLAGVLERALASFVALAGAERGFLLLYEGYDVVAQVCFGISPAESDGYSRHLAHQVLWTGEPVFIEDVQAEGPLAMQASIQALGLRSVLGVPLSDGGDVIGVVLADSRQPTLERVVPDMALVLALARQVSLVLARMRRLERVEGSLAHLEVLHRLALAASKAATLEALMPSVATAIAAATGAERIMVLEGETLLTRAAYDAQGRPLSAKDSVVSRTVTRWVFERREPLQLFDALSAGTFQAQKSVVSLGMRAIEAVPVTADGHLLGVLYTDSPDIAEATADGLRLLTGLAEVLGTIMLRGCPGETRP